MANHVALLTDGAKVERAARELMVEGSVIDRRVGQQQRRGSDIEQATAGGDVVSGVAVGQPSEVADADKATRQDVEQKAAEELDGVEGKGLFHSPVAVVFPGKRDAAVFELQQAVIGDGHTVGVAAEILDDLGGAAEGPFGVDDPASIRGGVQPAAEGLGIGEPGQIAKEAELPLLEGLKQSVSEEMPEAGAEDFD